jgi:hypothetical protein
VKPFAVILALGLVVLLAIQHQTLRRLRAENQQLSADQVEAAQLKEDPVRTENWQDSSSEIKSLRAENHDLPKLRNEVRELREQIKELERLQAENARLRSASQRQGEQTAPLPPFLANVPILSKASLTNAGFATPEAAAQTYFWAIREANQQAWLICLSPKLAQSLCGDGINDLFKGLLKQNASVTGYGFRDKQAEGADYVRLMVFGMLDVSSSIVTSGNGQAQPGRIGFQLRFQKVGGEWKLER